MTFAKGDRIKAPVGDTVYQVTEVTPIGDSFVVLQLYIEGSRPQVDISNPNPVLNTETGQLGPAPTETPEQAAEKMSQAAKDLNQ